MNYLLLNIILAACGVAGIIFRYLYSERHNIPLPPGPKPLPIIGNLLDFPGSKAWETFATWGEVYGDVVHLRSFGQSYIIINKFKVVHDLLEKRSSIYSGRPHFTMVTDLMDLGRSTAMLQYGNLWKKHRTMLHQQLNPTAIQQFHYRQVAAARGLLESILESPRDVELHIRRMVADVVIGIAYGHDTTPNDPFVGLAEQVLGAFARAMRPGEFLVDLIPFLRYVPEWVPGAGFQKFGRESKQIWTQSLNLPFEDVKRRLIEGTAPSSFVANTLAELGISGEVDPEEEDALKAVAGSMYSAGTDTTVAAIHSFILAMVLYPEVQNMAQAELDSVVGRERLPEFSDRSDLPYVDAVVKELFRWHPVTPTALPHTLAKDDTYNGYHIPKGAIVIANAWNILHDPDMYPDPFKFRPEHFLPDKEGKVARDSATAGAFGYGRRICPGNYLADASIWIAVASLLAAFNITPAQDDHGRPIDVNYALDPPPDIVVHPRPFPCSIKPRSAEIEKFIRQTAN